MNKIIVYAMVILFPCFASAEIIVDVLKVAGKPKAQVDTYLGKPSMCTKNKYGIKCQYLKGETDIVFIKGKADWITIEDIDDIPFSNNALQVLGLKNIRPTFSNDIVMRWESIQGLNEVSIFKGGTYSDYAYIKTKTK